MWCQFHPLLSSTTGRLPSGAWLEGLRGDLWLELFVISKAQQHSWQDPCFHRKPGLCRSAEEPACEYTHLCVRMWRQYLYANARLCECRCTCVIQQEWMWAEISETTKTQFCVCVCSGHVGGYNPRVNVEQCDGYSSRFRLKWQNGEGSLRKSRKYLRRGFVRLVLIDIQWFRSL